MSKQFRILSSQPNGYLRAVARLCTAGVRCVKGKKEKEQEESRGDSKIDRQKERKRGRERMSEHVEAERPDIRRSAAVTNRFM